MKLGSPVLSALVWPVFWSEKTGHFFDFPSFQSSTANSLQVTWEATAFIS